MGMAKTSPDQASSCLRKIRKPLVERRRRERMNQSIDHLKDLIADTIKHNVAPMTRVDKADILELTVTHLMQLKQKNHRRVATATDTSGYCNGFQDCAREVISFLVSNSLVGGTELHDLTGHLHNAYLHKSRSERASRNQGTNYSTPMRPHLFVAPTATTPAQLSGYSPIPQTSPELSELQESSGTCYTSGDCSSVDSRSYSSMDYSAGTSSCESRHSSDIVTIGDGKENAIGHVIKDTVWRPW